MDIEDLEHQIADEIMAGIVSDDQSYRTWNYNLTLIHVVGNLYKGTFEMHRGHESYSAIVEVVYDGNDYRWEVFENDEPELQK